LGDRVTIKGSGQSDRGGRALYIQMSLCRSIWRVEEGKNKNKRLVVIRSFRVESDKLFSLSSPNYSLDI